ATTHNGLATFSAGASSSTGFEITTGNLGINSGNATDPRLEVGGTASISGALTLNGVSYTFPATQGSASSFLQNNGSGTLTWATPKIVTSNSLDFDELANALSVDANTTITGGLFSLTFDHASTSGIFEAGTLQTDTISGSTGSVISLSNSATESLNFEVVGYASASAFYGSGLTNCGTSNFLQWSSATGKFSCVADTFGSSGAQIEVSEGFGNINAGTRVSSISFDANSFKVDNTGGFSIVSIDYGSSGVPSRSATNTWTALNVFSGGVSISSPFELTQSASIGGNLVAKGSITGSNLTGTNSGDVTLAGQNYLSLSGQQITANKINLASNVVGTLNIASTSFAVSVTSLTYTAPNLTLTAGYL